MAGGTYHIQPNTAQSENVLKLSTIDQIMPRKYMCSAYCFKLDNSVNPDDVTAQLAKALGATLAHLPQFAGELQVAPGDRNELQVYVGPDSNLLFRDHREWTGMDFEELCTARFPPSLLPATQLCVRDEDGTTQNGGMRTLMMQASYIPGGLLLVIQAHHSFTDAKGIELFIKVLSSHMNAQNQAQPGELEPLDDEALERWRLSYGTRKVKVDDFQEFKEDPDLLRAVLSGAATTDTIVPVIWTMKARDVDELHKFASSTKSDANHISKAEAVSAFLFRHICRARYGQTSSGEGKPPVLTLYFTSNLRARLEPALPEAYLGNASMVVPVRLPFERVCEGKDEVVLNEIATEIQKAVAACDTNHVRKIVGIYNTKPIGTLKANLGYYPGPNLMSADISTNVVYELEWGTTLGQIDCFRTIGATMSTANCSIHPKLRDGSLEVFMYHESKVIEAMKSDEEFVRFATFVTS